MMKKKGPNDCLFELREKVKVYSEISDTISEINALVKMNIRMLESELKDLEKRICPTCGVIHSPYSTKKH